MRGGNRCSPIRRKGEPPPALPRLREFAEGSSPRAHLERPCRVRKGEGRGKLLIHVLRRPPSMVGREATAIDDACTAGCSVDSPLGPRRQVRSEIVPLQ